MINVFTAVNSSDALITSTVVRTDEEAAELTPYLETDSVLEFRKLR